MAAEFWLQSTYSLAAAHYVSVPLYFSAFQWNTYLMTCWPSLHPGTCSVTATALVRPLMNTVFSSLEEAGMFLLTATLQIWSASACICARRDSRWQNWQRPFLWSLSSSFLPWRQPVSQLFHCLLLHNISKRNISLNFVNLKNLKCLTDFCMIKINLKR